MIDDWYINNFAKILIFAFFIREFGFLENLILDETETSEG